MTFPFPILDFGAVLSPFSFAFVTSGNSTADVGSVATANLSFGALATGSDVRYLVVSVGCNITSSASISSATIGGVAATVAIQRTDVSPLAAIIYAAVPTSTSGSIAVTYSSTAIPVGSLTCMGVYRMLNPSSSLPHATAFDDTEFSGALDLSLNIPSVGAGVGVTMSRNGSTTAWTGMTENFDVDTTGSNEWCSGAHTTSAGTPRTVTTQDGDTTPDDLVGVSASWGGSL